MESYAAARPLTQRLVSCVVVTERKRFKAAGFSVHARPAECLFWWDRMEMSCKICKGKCINLRKQDHALLVCIPSIARCLTNSTCVESIFNILLENRLYHITPSLSIVKLGLTIHGQDTIKLVPDKFASPPSEDYPSTTIDSTTSSEYHHPSTLRQGLLQRISRTNIIPQPQIIVAELMLIIQMI